MGLLLEKRRETIRYLSYILCLDSLEMHNIGIKSPQSLFYRAPERRWEFIKENKKTRFRPRKRQRKIRRKHALDQKKRSRKNDNGQEKIRKTKQLKLHFYY